MRNRFRPAPFFVRMIAFCRLVPKPIVGGSHVVLFPEQFDEMGGVGKSAHRTDFRDGLVRGDQQQTCMDQPLTDKPLVRRYPVDVVELFFERSHGSMSLLGQFVDRCIGEYVCVDDLLESIP